MKLFVWNNPYTVSYGASLLFAVAEDLESAKALAQSKDARWFSYGQYPDGASNYNEDNVANYSRNDAPELGEPMRIIELPCAEWHKWEE